MAEVILVSDPEALAREAAERFTRLAREACDSHGRFSVVLSGGSTPAGLYQLLAQDRYQAQVPWGQVHLFWGDERCVPPADPESNFRLASEALLVYVPIPTENIHRIRGELEPRSAARSYDKELQGFFCGPRTRFDLVLLGLGTDGHTASLFPESDALRETERLAVAVEATYLDRPTQRVTLTPAAINTARCVLFLVSGSSKADILHAVLKGPAGQFPAQRIAPTAGELVWLVDSAAAARLTR
jgi:6-phosphogluconolactonase